MVQCTKRKTRQFAFKGHPSVNVTLRGAWCANSGAKRDKACEALVRRANFALNEDSLGVVQDGSRTSNSMFPALQDKALLTWRGNQEQNQ